MGRVNIDDLKSGMVLASNLVDSKGRFLLAQGTVLEDKHFQIMKTWGITEADIQGFDREKAAEESMAQIQPDVLKKSEEYASNFFKYANLNLEIMQEIKRLSVLDAAKKISVGQVLPEIAFIEQGQKGVEASHAAVQEKLMSEKDLIQNVQLVSFPDIYHKIVKVLNDPRSSAYHLSEVISKDTSLSAKILRLANSAFYGLPSKVDTITRAITFIGISEISTLAMGILAIRFFKGVSPKVIDMKTFWMHSIACGTIASIIAHHKTGLSEERFFVAGLLHDIGRLIMLKVLPNNTTNAILMSRTKPAPLQEVENNIFGFDHARIASLLLKKWEFPMALEHMVHHHHDPFRSPDPLESSIIHFANIMAIAFHLGHSGEIFVPPIKEKAWETINISLSVLVPAMSQAERLVGEITKEFLYEK